MLDWAFALVLELRTGQVSTSDLDSLREQLETAPWPDVDTWGTSPQAQRQAAAVADLLGGPAPARKD